MESFLCDYDNTCVKYSNGIPDFAMGTGMDWDLGIIDFSTKSPPKQLAADTTKKIL